MSGSRQNKNTQSKTTSVIAAEAGKIMAEEGIADFRQAKLKARERLRLPKDSPLPTNQEIQQACDAHLCLYTPEQDLYSRQVRMMQNALAAMMHFSDYKPRLVTEFLHHPATADAVIELHLEAANPEAVAHFLDESRISFEQSERFIKFGLNDVDRIPAFSFLKEKQHYTLLVFSINQIRKCPKNQSGTGSLHRMTQSQTDEWLRAEAL